MLALCLRPLEGDAEVSPSSFLRKEKKNIESSFVTQNLSGCTQEGNQHPRCIYKILPRERRTSEEEEEEVEGGDRETETKLRGVSVGRMKEESGGRSVEEAAYGCRKSTAGGSISI